MQLDEHGSGVEVYPAGTELQPGGEVGGNFVKKDARGYGSTHFALSVATDADTVKAIAQRAGWKCFDCNRGPFHVIEVWVENETMVEILPPAYAQEYLAFTRPDNIKAAMAKAALRLLGNAEGTGLISGLKTCREKIGSAGASSRRWRAKARQSTP